MLKFAFYIVVSCGLAVSAAAEEMSLEDTIVAVNDSVVSVVTDSGENQSIGAGIVLSADGYVVTNAHVTDGADKIIVITTDDEEYDADLIGSDDKTDISLLKVNNPHEFKPAQFADSDLVRTGNSVFAIGNPFGLGNSVSSGIISAKERSIERGPYDNFLQTDTVINQGNSGGPLFNADGEVVGMNTAIFSTNGNNMGVGFSTPSNIVKWVVEELKNNGKVIRGWIGVGVKNIRVENEDVKNRLAIVSMAEDSPAAKAGLQVGDILVKVGELDLSNSRLFSLQISKTKPETKLPISVLRDGNVFDTEVSVATMVVDKEDKKISRNDDAMESSYQHKFDTEVASIGMSVSYDEQNQEIIVENVQEQSEAKDKGIRAGDRIKSFNGRPIYGIEDFLVKIKEAVPSGQVILQFIDEEGIDTIILKLREQNE